MDKTAIRAGMQARSRDGHLLGTISVVGEDELVIAAGGFFDRDQAIKRADVLEVTQGEVMLKNDQATLRAVNARPVGVPPPPPRAVGASRVPPAKGAGADPRSAEATRTGDVVPVPAPDRSERHPTAGGGLHLQPRDLERARMDSAKFQDHHSELPRPLPKAVRREGGALHLHPRDLERARMDSAKFQEHHADYRSPGGRRAEVVMFEPEERRERRDDPERGVGPRVEPDPE